MGASQTTNSSNNSNTNYSNTANSAPGWAPQVSALTTAFNQAPGALTTAQGYTAPTGTASNLNGNGTISGAGTGMAANGSAASGIGLGTLSNFNASASNNPSSVISAANAYMQGQNIPAQVQAAMQQGEETARDVTLPGIEQSAATSGNSDSSRTGVAQGIVERGLAEQAASLNNALSGQAFGNGLNLAQTQASNNNTADLTAANSAAAQGTNAATAGQNLYSGALTNTALSNANNETNYNNDVTNSYSPLQAFMNLIGSTSWGSTTSASGNSQSQGTGTSTTQNDPGALGIVTGLLGGIGNLIP